MAKGQGMASCSLFSRIYGVTCVNLDVPVRQVTRLGGLKQPWRVEEEAHNTQFSEILQGGSQRPTTHNAILAELWRADAPENNVWPKNARGNQGGSQKALQLDIAIRGRGLRSRGLYKSNSLNERRPGDSP